MKLRKLIGSLIIVALLALGSYWYEENGQIPPSSPSDSEIVQLVFPSDRYPETAKHIQDAIANGESAICTIDREQAENNRRLSLKGVPTKKGYDRDEWPMAMCKEGGEGADIEYISPSDNRGAGSWVGNQLEGYADGVRVEFMFQ
ncbi:DNA-entry nuclease [Bacillus sp. FJAT-27264]|uniref:NucA/NucB deoxyribonuclease domain-containing protein n=1 Tax=Paenibacillus sp. (strain DSM 101736 / FJAT-27264) TaxID=1850362 RepID=UPI000807C87E|nr:NucA/NucB deoxyribonuclease domain-containing protein [Bacillus sp. FJAT-27264]OBZ19061.1 DNA-entry nuclease [Bacillus sp. FJAT-27264]